MRRDILAMQVLAPLSSRYLPWSMSAMRPSGVVKVLNEIILNRRRHIVELGGGISTCYIGRLLRQRGEGRLWTVEHDDRWADVLEQTLAGEALSEVVTVVRAPLSPISPAWPGEDTAWYDREAIRDALAGLPVDLLVVDGPPAYSAAGWCYLTTSRPVDSKMARSARVSDTVAESGSGAAASSKKPASMVSSVSRTSSPCQASTRNSTTKCW